ncbi:MAG: ROK family protein [Verrucomicrobiota bacterium]|nr:ROK family protein [Limisphaera sp.]MDW8382927.1 ROK family protein [Verrucomicrobiota bacterium]
MSRVTPYVIGPLRGILHMVVARWPAQGPGLPSGAESFKKNLDMSAGATLLHIAPKVSPPLDPDFRPIALAYRRFCEAASGTARSQPMLLALEQPGGLIFHHRVRVFPPDDTRSEANILFLERVVKTLLWSRGGWRLHVNGPKWLVTQLLEHYRETVEGRFDDETVARRMFDHPLEIVPTDQVPPERTWSVRLGRHWEGCRIGFDLGGSDRKVAAVVHGQVVFSDETPWDPCTRADPQYHFEGIMDMLQSAAKRLPRVDAIGGSAAGVYVQNRVKVASLFRSIPPDVFASRVRDLFYEIQEAWGGVPLVVMNDGEVAALAGSMMLERSAVLGLAMGTSLAGGWVNPDGNLTSWINELAFVPVDLQPQAPQDEWSQDRGVGAQYFSQQAVGRLLVPAGIDLPTDLSLPDKLHQVQALLAEGDPRARQVFETIGVYLGYQLAYLAEFYPVEHVLLLGRVTSGTSGQVLLEQARHVLQLEFPTLAARLSLHLPGERFKRHGQAIAAASLPEIPPDVHRSVA